MSDSALHALDEQRFKGFHWQATLTTGLGVFCDGYDLSSLALVLSMVLHSFGQAGLTSVQSALMSASALVGAAVGALLFGVLGQWGRKRFYGIDVLVLGVAAIAQAFAPNIAWLIGLRFVLGIGVGADYVLSPVIMAEHANRADRGRALGLGFGTMWPIGALAAVLLKFLLGALHVPDDLQWRLVLAGGAVPALGVLYFRRKMPETVRYLAKLAGEQGEAERVIAAVVGEQHAAPARDVRGFGQVFAQHARPILAAALLWMLYDLVVYVFILFGPNIIAKSLGMDPATFAFLTQILFVLPPSFIGSLFIIDRFGRKPLQGWGFLGGAVLLLVFALMQHQLLAMPALAFAVYGLLNIAMTGPGLVSGAGILGVELAPTRVRSVAQSITVAGGRIGAAISGFAFPLLFRPLGHGGVGQVGAYVVIAGLALLGALGTWLLVPETGKFSLETINRETEPATAAAS
ncbi:MAG TPA: MFS transporter [Caulobacteraceae bacterium]|nr:MFS transporter [Caulobacteraceae bacterium]